MKKSPIFVIGSYRSGTSVLTWCLGQHPNILPLEETNWIAYLSVYLDNLYLLGTINEDHSNLSSIGITGEEFYSYFGRSVSNFFLENMGKYVASSEKRAQDRQELKSQFYQIARGASEPKERWVDGTPENSHFVYGLNRLYPDAKFVHLLRNPQDVAKSLQNFSSAGGRDYQEEEAYRTWIRLVRASLQAEAALGPEKVLRVNYDDLVANPQRVLTQCLEFVGESFDEACLMPLKQRINSSRPNRVDASCAKERAEEKPYVKEAIELYTGVVQEKMSLKMKDDAVYKSFRDSFLQFAKQFRLEEVDKVTAWGRSLDKQIAQCNKRILELQKEVEVLGRWGKSLDAAVAERDNAIANLNEQLQRIA